MNAEKQEKYVKEVLVMKRILIITLIIAGLTAAYSFAEMQRGMMGTKGQEKTSETPYSGGYYPCPQMMGQGMMGYGGYGMMGPGMMGYGMMGHHRMGGMMGPGMMGYGDYGTGKYDPEAYQKYLDDTVDLRKKLHNRKFDYFEARRNPDTKRETLLKIEKEIHDIQWEIYEKAPR